jgi:cobalt-zinc-cadmium efflux system membrane fusion protein
MTTASTRTWTRWAWPAGTVALAVVLLLTRAAWWPAVDRSVNRLLGKTSAKAGAEHDEDSHAGHTAHEDHAGHSDASSLELSTQARANLGLTKEFLQPVKLTTFRKTVSIPSMLTERPGRTELHVSTPMTGVVTEVAAFQGAAVQPGSLLFRIRLTHEDLVQSQTDFVRTLGEVDVETKEITRLKGVTESGAIAGKTLLERQYSKEKLEALLKAQREALRLHGLSDRQVDQIAKDRRLLSELRVLAPAADGSTGTDELQLTERESAMEVSFTGPPAGDDAAPSKKAPSETVPLVVEEVDVQRGQSVEQGARLCSLADYSRLYIEGKAFEQDAAAINKAVLGGWKISAAFPDGKVVEGLDLEYVASEVDPQTRTLNVFVELPNTLLRDTQNAQGQRFVTWQYRPGQRLQLRIPVDEWADQIVVPVDAVAQEGAESFVFQLNGKHFDRIPVHVVYRDQTAVVIANDGSLFPGTTIAMRSAHQMQMALKNKAGGAIDPHAGHTH